MPSKTMKELFVEMLLYILDETFENVHGVFLDKGTSLFETLATISAEEASRPVSATCASLSAQVEHVRFYLDRTIEFAQGRPMPFRQAEAYLNVLILPSIQHDLRAS